MLILGWAFASTIFGVRIQAEQSRVGKVLSSWDILPPILGVFSTMSTGYPASAMSNAVWIPAMPPPITRARLVTRLSPGFSGVFKFTLATAARIRITAFSVASSISLWIQEQCSRMFAISTIYGFNPARSAAPRKVVSCIRGEQEQTTMPLRFFSWIAARIFSCPASEHIY